MLGLDLVLYVYSGFICCVFFHDGLGHFVAVLLAFVVLGLVSSVLNHEIGWEECLRNDLFCIEWDVKPLLVSNTDARFVCDSKGDCNENL